MVFFKPAFVPPLPSGVARGAWGISTLGRDTRYLKAFLRKTPARPHLELIMGFPGIGSADMGTSLGYLITSNKKVERTRSIAASKSIFHLFIII